MLRFNLINIARCNRRVPIRRSFHQGRYGIILLFLFSLIFTCQTASADRSKDLIKIGLNYPKFGPYAKEGLDQWLAANLAVQEINRAGGMLGKKIALVWRDSRSRPEVTVSNVTELIDKEKVVMVFGGSSSAVAIAAGNVCQKKGILFFATLSYSTETTGTQAHRHTFRECYNSWMAARALSYYLKENFPAKRYMYITADYTWGHTTEASLRKFTDTHNREDHKGILTPFPEAGEQDFRKALSIAQSYKPDLLVLVLFGKHMETAIRLAETMGIKESTQIVVPNLTLSMAEGAGPDAMEGVLGTLPWCWKVPYQFDYHRGKAFVETFAERYYRYPSTSGASAYTILFEYKAAVERAKSFESAKVIKALEDNRYKFLVIKPLLGHEYTLLKDRQVWRNFDHQSLQTVYVVKGKSAEQVRRDKFELDYFEIIGSLSGEKAARTEQEWVAMRIAAGKPPHLEPLPDE